MVKMPKIADGWLDGDSGLQPPEITPAPLNTADTAFQMPALPSNSETDMSMPLRMTASPRLIEFLKSYEKSPGGGPALRPYRSPEKGTDTVGWGHKIQAGEDYSHGLTSDEADKLFRRDLAAHQKRVQRRVTVPLSQQQFDALVSLSYNLPSALNPKKSTLLRELNNGNYAVAGDEFPRWDRGGPDKARMPGLTERRNYERNIFLNGVYTDHQ